MQNNVIINGETFSDTFEEIKTNIRNLLKDYNINDQDASAFMIRLFNILFASLNYKTTKIATDLNIKSSSSYRNLIDMLSFQTVIQASLPSKTNILITVLDDIQSPLVINENEKFTLDDITLTAITSGIITPSSKKTTIECWAGEFKTETFEADGSTTQKYQFGNDFDVYYDSIEVEVINGSVSKKITLINNLLIEEGALQAFCRLDGNTGKYELIFTYPNYVPTSDEIIKVKYFSCQDKHLNFLDKEINYSGNSLSTVANYTIVNTSFLSGYQKKCEDLNYLKFIVPKIIERGDITLSSALSYENYISSNFPVYGCYAIFSYSYKISSLSYTNFPNEIYNIYIYCLTNKELETELLDKKTIENANRLTLDYPAIVGSPLIFIKEKNYSFSNYFAYKSGELPANVAVPANNFSIDTNIILKDGSIQNVIVDDLDKSIHYEESTQNSNDIEPILKITNNSGYTICGISFKRKLSSLDEVGYISNIIVIGTNTDYNIKLPNNQVKGDLLLTTKLPKLEELQDTMFIGFDIPADKLVSYKYYMIFIKETYIPMNNYLDEIEIGQIKLYNYTAGNDIIGMLEDKQTVTLNNTDVKDLSQIAVNYIKEDNDLLSRIKNDLVKRTTNNDVCVVNQAGTIMLDIEAHIKLNEMTSDYRTILTNIRGKLKENFDFNQNVYYDKIIGVILNTDPSIIDVDLVNPKTDILSSNKSIILRNINIDIM